MHVTFICYLNLKMFLFWLMNEIVNRIARIGIILIFHWIVTHNSLCIEHILHSDNIICFQKFGHKLIYAKQQDKMET